MKYPAIVITMLKSYYRWKRVLCGGTRRSGLSYLIRLECSKCGKTFDPDKVQNVCDRCGKPLLARYD